MRIGIDGLLLWGEYSGVEHTILNLISALARLGGNDYTLFVDRNFSAGDLPTVTLRRAPFSSRHRWRRFLWQQWAFPDAIARERLDLFHAPGYIMPLRCPVPAVITVHDVIALTHPRLCRRANRWHFRRYLPQSVARAARVIVPTQATRDELIRVTRLSADKIHVIPWGIEKRFFRTYNAASRERVCREYGLPERFFLFVGNWEPKKNLPSLLAAMALLRSAGRTEHLVIAGKLGWDYRHGLRLIEESESVSSAVHRIGYVKIGDLPALYAQCVAFVFPSIVEGFGLPPLEAMACGAPVIVSDCAALRETAGPGACVVPADDPTALADEMVRVAEDSELRNQLIERGRAWAAQFTWEKTARAVSEVYQEAAARP